MKIIQSISKVYHDRLPFYRLLGERVDQLMTAKKKKSWHYFSRVKSEESFALKLETGRTKVPSAMDDFFACTLVVENMSEIQRAIDMVQSILSIDSRKPRLDEHTHKSSSSFDFDDLRLYVHLPEVEYLPTGELSALIFEVQIKTFLQHAWTVATHDMIYKSNSVSWPKERVAFQIKAMLEQAEISISGAEGLSQLPELAKNTDESSLLNAINHFLITTFPESALPSDILRLCRITSDLLKWFSLDLDSLKKLLQKETDAGRGTLTLNLSPYGILLQSIIHQRPQLVEKTFSTGFYTKFKGLFIPPEISLSNLTLEDTRKIVTI